MLFSAAIRRDVAQIETDGLNYHGEKGTTCDTNGAGVSTRILVYFLGTCSPSFRRNVRGQLCHHSRAMKQRKAQMIKARVSSKMKRGIDDLADKRGESEAVIVREALTQYLRRSTILLESRPSYRRKKPT